MKSILALALIFATAITSSRADGGSFTSPIGLQLYSLRSQFALRGVSWTLDRVKEFGITEVELAGTYNLSAGQFKKELDARGLKAISSHFPYARYKLDLPGVVTEAKALGLQFAGCAWIDHVGKFDKAQALEAAKVFNCAGEALAKVGITFFYHCHGYEFEPYGSETVFDLLVKETKPEHVSYEMDILWVVFPGQDPAKLMNKYPDRWKLMHLKDLKKGVATGALTGKTDVVNDVTLGTGQMNWPSIFSAAQKIGIKHYFIEDESPTSMEQVPNSIAFLKGLKW